MSELPCPVCDETGYRIVTHHDHLSDLCAYILHAFRKEVPVPPETFALTPEFDEFDDWVTFPDTRICERCNSIDTWVKRDDRLKQGLEPLPWWVSFSPAEMVELFPVTHDRPARVALGNRFWQARRLIYAPYFRRLRDEYGIPEEFIRRKRREPR